MVRRFQLSSPCSLLLGKIVSVDSSGHGRGEVTVQWYTPEEFIIEGGRRVPDVGTESVDSACFTFPSLLESRKLPTAVWAAVEDSVPTTSLEEENS